MLCVRVQCCFTSTETASPSRDEESRTATSTFSHLPSSLTADKRRTAGYTAMNTHRLQVLKVLTFPGSLSKLTNSLVGTLSSALSDQALAEKWSCKLVPVATNACTHTKITIQSCIRTPAHAKDNHPVLRTNACTRKR